MFPLTRHLDLIAAESPDTDASVPFDSSVSRARWATGARHIAILPPRDFQYLKNGC